MKTILGLIAISLLGMLTLSLMIAAVVIQLLPALLAAAVVIAVCRTVTRGTRHPPTKRVASSTPWRPTGAVPPPHVGAAHGGWVLLPVWLPPKTPSARPYIDAEVIEEHRRE